MKIIIPGDLSKAREKQLKVRIFICPDCGCKWTADKTEYIYGPQLDPGPYMNCPCCDKGYVLAEIINDTMY